jgi:hypothetical protein
MFQSIIKDDVKSLIAMTKEFLEAGRTLLVLRCTSHILQGEVDASLFTLEAMNDRLRILRLHSFRLRSLLTTATQGSMTSPQTQKLLAFSILDDTSGTEGIIRTSSPLNQYFTGVKNMRPNFRALRVTEAGEQVVFLSDLSKAAEDLLSNDLRQMISRHSEDSKKSKAFNAICMQHVIEKCKYGDTCKYLHVSSDRMKEFFNQRFRMFLEQMIVVNAMGITLQSQERRSIQG